MAGIYIHIPFCKKACHYCNFHFSTQTKYINDFVKAIVKEVALQQKYLQGLGSIETIYFGGGTPSLLDENGLKNIIEALQNHFEWGPQVEFTLEANPDDINVEKTQLWKKWGVNRLSIGIQSFQQHSLEWMNRAHTVEQSHAALTNAKKAGFENISCDLIYGTPLLTDKELLDDLYWLKYYDIPHISCYALTVEEKTALHVLINKQKVQAVNPAHQAKHFEIIQSELNNRGFEHYEISNFAIPGKRSQHNSNYWNGVSYLGLGPSAHSYNINTRQWNVANNHLYMQSLEQGSLTFEIEHLDTRTRYNEYMMIALRKMEGFSLPYIEQNFGEAYMKHTESVLKSQLRQNNFLKTSDGYTLTKNAKFFADGIASEFFIV